MNSSKVWVFLFGFLIIFMLVGGVTKRWGLEAQAQASLQRATQSIYVQEEAEKAQIRIDKLESLSTTMEYAAMATAALVTCWGITQVGMRAVLVWRERNMAVAAVTEAEAKAAKAIRQSYVMELAFGMYIYSPEDGPDKIVDAYTGTAVALAQASTVNESRVRLLAKQLPAEALANALAQANNGSDWLGQLVQDQLTDNQEVLNG